jgi:hypothetical protein
MLEKNGCFRCSLAELTDADVDEWLGQSAGCFEVLSYVYWVAFDSMNGSFIEWMKVGVVQLDR